jgi:hypothetical protein
MALRALVVALTGLAIAAPAAHAQQQACASVTTAQGTATMDAYAATAPHAVGPAMVRIPAIALDGSATSPTLPVGPCQTIYRFAFAPTTGGPYRYAEVDWNTEGLPRGPNNAFISPHFDFHFYLRPRRWVDHRLMCPSTNGRTCDEQETPYAQMQRFLRIPDARFVPRAYFPDTGSSIPLMGLHLLDGLATYTVDAVNHTPVLIYGTYDRKVLFSEASVTLQTLNDAVTAPGHQLSFAYRPPRVVQGHTRWPTRFVVRYEPATQTFVAGFQRFVR